MRRCVVQQIWMVDFRNGSMPLIKSAMRWSTPRGWALFLRSPLDPEQHTEHPDCCRGEVGQKIGGTFTSVRGFQGIPQRDIHFTATFVRSYAQEFEKLDRLRGKITLRVAEVYPPERAADAHRRLEAGGTRGWLVIQF